MDDSGFGDQRRPDANPSNFQQPQAPIISQFQKKMIPIPLNRPADYYQLLKGPYRSQLAQETQATLIVLDAHSATNQSDSPVIQIIAYSDAIMNSAEQKIIELFNNPDRAQQLLQQAQSQNSFNAYMRSDNPMSAFRQFGPDSTIDVIQVPRNVVGLIIGQKATTLKRIKDFYNVELSFERNQDADPSSEIRNLTLRGSHDNVMKAKEGLRNVIQTKSLNSIFGTGVRRTLRIPNNKVGLVIGSGASTLRAIKNQCGVDINIPQDPIPDDPSQRSVEICGDGDKIERAIKMILDIVAGNTNVVKPDLPSSQIIVEDDKIGLIIGKNGATYKKLQRLTNCKLDIPTEPTPHTNPPTRTITLLGEDSARQSMIDELKILLHGNLIDPDNMDNPETSPEYRQLYVDLCQYYGSALGTSYFNYYVNQQQQSVRLQKEAAQQLNQNPPMDMPPVMDRRPPVMNQFPPPPPREGGNSFLGYTGSR